MNIIPSKLILLYFLHAFWRFHQIRSNYAVGERNNTYKGELFDKLCPIINCKNIEKIPTKI